MPDPFSQAPPVAPRDSAAQTAIPLPEGPVVIRCHWCSATAVQTDVDITRPGVKAHRPQRVALCSEHLAMVNREFAVRELERRLAREDPLRGYKGPGR